MKTVKTVARYALYSGLALSASIFASNAMAVPLKIESENVVFYGDVDPELAAEQVKKWEIYRKMIFALSGIANPPPDKTKLTVYGFYDTQDLQRFAYRGIAGVYTQGIDGPIFLTSVNNKYTEDGAAEETGFHEYTHHVLNAIVREGFPRWYNEGFAEYLSTMDVEDEMVAVGDPSNGFSKLIKEGRISWIDPETVLKAIAFYPDYTRREWRKGGSASFYAQSWLYVHYMRSKPEYNSKLTDYLKALKMPDIDPIEAFEATFEVDIDDFHRDAARYYRDDEFVVTQYTPGPAIMNVEMSAERLSEEELIVAQIPARHAFLSDRNKKDFVRDLGKAYKVDPTNPKITFGYTAVSINNENYNAAVERAEAELAGRPDNIDLVRAAADARYHRYVNVFSEQFEDDGGYSPFEMTEDVQLAMDRFGQIMKEDPFDRDAIGHIVRFYGNSKADVSDEVFQAARVMDVRYMDTFSPGTGMNLATIYAKRGFELDACEYYKKAIDESEDWSDRRMKFFQPRLDWFGETYGQNCKIESEE